MENKELVNHPDHYKDERGKECIDYMLERFGFQAVIHFCILNSYKYRFRAGKKDNNPEDQDIKKALWYEEKAKELIQQSAADTWNSYEELLSLQK